MRYLNLNFVLSIALMAMAIPIGAQGGEGVLLPKLDETDDLIFFEDFADSGNGWHR